MQFQAPQNQQKPSDHDRLMTSNPNRHNFQTIPKSCTANFRIMPEVKKRYIIRAYTQGSGSAGNQQKRPDDHGKRPDRNSFQKSATIHIFCGEGFRALIIRQKRSHMRDPSRLSGNPRCFFYGSQREPSNFFQHFSNVSNALNALNALEPTQRRNYWEKMQLSEENTTYSEKPQIHNIKCRFYNI